MQAILPILEFIQSILTKLRGLWVYLPLWALSRLSVLPTR